MPNYVLETPSKKVKDPTGADIEAALTEALQEHEYAILGDDAGNFVQYDGARVEARRGDDFYRVDLDGVARRAFAALRAGKTELPDDLSWREASADLAAETGKMRTYWRSVLVDAAILIGLIVVAVLVGVILLKRATGAP